MCVIPAIWDETDNLAGGPDRSIKYTCIWLCGVIWPHGATKYYSIPKLLYTDKEVTQSVAKPPLDFSEGSAKFGDNFHSKMEHDWSLS